MFCIFSLEQQHQESELLRQEERTNYKKTVSLCVKNIRLVVTLSKYFYLENDLICIQDLHAY